MTNGHAGLPESILAELRSRRGRRYLFDKLDLAGTALLVIDMQNAFVDPASPLGVSCARSIVPSINDLAGALRNAGCPVYWVRSTFSPEGRGSWPLYFDSLAPGADSEFLRSHFYAASPWHEFWPELDIRADDEIADKDRFSAFVAGASDLETRLRARGIDTLVIAGTLTNVCCESSMRDAMMLDFKCILASDANAAQNDDDHLASLANASRYFGDVMTVSEILNQYLD